MAATSDDGFDQAFSAFSDLGEFFADTSLSDGLLTDRRAAQAEIVDKTLAIGIAEQDSEIDTDSIAALYQLRQHAQDRAARIDLALDFVDASRLWLRLLEAETVHGMEGDPAEIARRAKGLRAWSSQLIGVLRATGAVVSPQTARAAVAPLVDRDVILRQPRERAEGFARGEGQSLVQTAKVLALREEYADLALLAVGGKDSAGV
ncbi:hypothetical protein ACW14Y_42750 (plasmid) [Kitasatospora sp. cg17-2]